MSINVSKGSFWTVGVSGLIGMFIGASSVLFTKQQANIAENQFYMELDQLRHALFLKEGVSFEEKIEDLRLLKVVRDNGFRIVFSENLERDIKEIEDSIQKIKSAKEKSEDAARSARVAELKKAEKAAQKRKEQAVRTNPLIYENCGRGTNRICP